MYNVKAYSAASATSRLASTKIVRRDPTETDVQIEILFCGICHSDLHQVRNQWSDFMPTVYPCIPGHEIVGRVTKVGSAVSSFKLGDLVGVGCMVDSDGTCPACKAGLEQFCPNTTFTYNLPDKHLGGVTYGGYSESIVVDQRFVLRVPANLNLAGAAPLLCAGITTYNALRHSGALPGDLVAVQGVGGLGHLGIQFAKKFGYKVAAIGRGPGNAALAKKLGAHVYIDSKATTAAAELQKLGGAQVILATAPNSKAMSELIDGLGPNGKLMVVGAAFDPIEVTPLQLISGSRTIQGWASGTPTDAEDTLRFAELTGVRPMIETYPLDKAAEAYARMMSGDAQFRVVLTMQGYLPSGIAADPA